MVVIGLKVFNEIITLYAFGANPAYTINAYQYEGGVRMPIVQLISDRKTKTPVDLTSSTGVLINIKKPDGNCVCNNCEIIDAELGKIQFTITNQMTVLSTVVDCEIEVIYSGTENIKFSGIRLSVGRSNNGSDVISEPEMLAFQEAISEANKLITKANEALDRAKQIIDTPVITDTSEITAIEPNKFYQFGEVTDLELTLATPKDNSILNEYMFEFVSGEIATTLTLPDTVKWTEPPVIETNRKYQVSIMNNVGLMVGVDYE